MSEAQSAVRAYEPAHLPHQSADYGLCPAPRGNRGRITRLFCAP